MIFSRTGANRRPAEARFHENCRLLQPQVGEFQLQTGHSLSNLLKYQVDLTTGLPIDSTGLITEKIYLVIHAKAMLRFHFQRGIRRLNVLAVLSQLDFKEIRQH